MVVADAFANAVAVCPLSRTIATMRTLERRGSQMLWWPIAMESTSSASSRPGKC